MFLLKKFPLNLKDLNISYTKINNKDKIRNILVYGVHYFNWFVYAFVLFLIETLIKPRKIFRVIMVIFVYILLFSIYSF